MGCLNALVYDRSPARQVLGHPELCSGTGRSLSQIMDQCCTGRSVRKTSALLVMAQTEEFNKYVPQRCATTLCDLLDVPRVVGQCFAFAGKMESSSGLGK